MTVYERLAQTEADGISGTPGVRAGFGRLRPPPVITATEMFLQPAVKRDEQITTAHLPDLKLGDADATVSPGNGHCGP